MNTEYALIRLLLQEPKHISELASKGFNSKYFKNPEYAKTYDLIFDRYTKYASVPTSDDLAEIEVDIGDEDVPHTIEHCVAVMYENKVKDIMQKAIMFSGEQLLKSGPEASIDFLRKAINSIPSLDSTSHSAEISETTDAFIERYHYRALNKGKIIGIETGFHEIDKHVRGLLPGWFCVIQGRNGQYKSWVLAKIVAHQFMLGKNVMVYSAEMSREEFEERVYSLCLGNPPRAMSLGELNAGEYNRMQEFLQEVKDGKYGKLYINDNPQNLDFIKMDTQRIMERHPIDIIHIDSAYRLKGPGKSDPERFGNIARGCKDLAKELEVPVVVTIQANRDFAKANPSAKKETQGSGMSAFGSDAWNQEADIMWIIHRTPDHAPFHFSDFIMDKFRHAEKLDSMLKINLKEPILEETDREKAIARINGENPKAQKMTTDIFAETSQAFQTDMGSYTVEDDEEEEDA